jgi:hypothetical protein
MEDKDHKDENDGKAAAPRGPGALVPSLLLHIVALSHTLSPLPPSLLSLSYVNSPDYNDNLVHDGCSALQWWWGDKRSMDATEALAHLLDLMTGTDSIVNRDRLVGCADACGGDTVAVLADVILASVERGGGE